MGSRWHTRKADVFDLESLRRRAIRARVWNSVDPLHRAAVGVVRELIRRGDFALIARIKRSSRVMAMIETVQQGILRVLQSVGGVSFRVRAVLVGARIVCEKIVAYQKSGVFKWAPWVKQWLKDRETLYFLGSNYIGWAQIRDECREMRWGCGNGGRRISD